MSEQMEQGKRISIFDGINSTDERNGIVRNNAVKDRVNKIQSDPNLILLVEEVF